MNDARFRRAVLTVALVWLAVAAAVIVLPRAVATFVMNAANCAAAGAGAWACLHRARREPAAAAGWAGIAAGLAILSAYQFYPVAAQPLLGGLPAFPGVADWVSIADFPLYGLGLLLFPIAPSLRLERLRTALDGLAFSAAIFCVAWIVGLGTVVTASELDTASRTLAAMQFTGSALTLGIVVYLTAPRPQRLAGPIGWIALGMLSEMAFNLPVSVMSLEGRYYLGHPLDLLLLAGILSFVLAPFDSRPVRDPVWREDEPRERRASLWVPYIPAGIALAAGMWRLGQPGMPGDIILGWTGLGLGIVVLIRQYLALRDIERLSRRLEEQIAERTHQLAVSQAALVQSERMEAVGRMAGGIAHDFNNLVHAITAWADVLGHAVARGTPAADAVQRIIDTGARAHAVVRRLLTFARRQPVAPRTVDLGQALQEAAPLLHQLAGADLRLVLRPAGGTVFMDPAQLEQLLSTLTVRARDAMPRGGSLTLQVESVNLAPEPDGFGGGPHVRLSATDTAPAMTADARRTAFDAFALSDEGTTGLALATCETIATQAGGRIRAAGSASGGNTIFVDLPRAAPD